MKYKNGLMILVVAVAGITFGALAEKQTSGKKVTLLRAGLVCAELHVDDRNQVQIQSTGNTRLMGDAGRTKVATGGFLLKITSGTNAISIQADEAIFDFDALAEQQSTEKRVYHLKTGSASAELIVKEGTKIELQGTARPSSISATYAVNYRTVVATNGAILKIVDGTNSISVQANEIIGVPPTQQ